MERLPILPFEPVFKETVWGGRHIETLLGKTLPSDGPYGESWEIVDLPDDQSIAVGGALNGKTLGALCSENPDALLGGAPLLEGRFPILIKFLDAQKTLSVQVHPDEAACARLGGAARPKTEAWYIIDSEPDAILYVGLRPGVERKMFIEAVQNGTVEELLYKLPVKSGDFIFLPSGTVHAIGAGIVLAEVQQSSDTTYRVFDWNRVGLDGKPRQLHVDEALEAIAFGTSGPPPCDAPASGNPGIACDSFTMESIYFEDGQDTVLKGVGPIAITGITGKGEVTLQASDSVSTMGRGQTRLIPAALSSAVRVKSKGSLTLLITRIPVNKEEAE